MTMADVPEWVDVLVRAGRQAPSADNSQPWRFWWDGLSLSVAFDDLRGKKGLGLDHPANLLALGAVIENLAQAANALQIPAEALETSLAGEQGPSACLSWSHEARAPIDETSLALHRRHTNRGRFYTERLDATLHERLSAMTEGPVRALVMTAEERCEPLRRLVRDASEIRFQTEEIHRWLSQSLRFTPDEIARGDGLDVATLMLPPGGRGLLKLSSDWKRMSFLNRLGAYRIFAALEAAMLRDCGALVVVVGPAQADGIEIAAGRLMQRLWIELNAHGWAVHPYFVLADQLARLRSGLVAKPFDAKVAAIAASTAELLHFRDETLFILLRVGLPRIPKPIRSRRLPIDSLLTVVSH